MADLVIVNKADGELIPAARRACSEYTSALKLIRTKVDWHPPVLMVSAEARTGIAEVWATIKEFRKYSTVFVYSV